MHSLVLIEKYLSSSLFWSNLVRDKRITELSVEQVLDKYQGFEGDFVCYFQINKNIDLFQIKISECLRLKSLGGCLLLHVISSPDSMPSLLENQTTKIGYDVGVCDEEKTVYSSIFHEILFGHLDELVDYKRILNENLLFPDRSLAEKYVKLHDQMSAEGESVEDYEKMTIYEVWKQKDLTSSPYTKISKS